MGNSSSFSSRSCGLLAALLCAPALFSCNFLEKKPGAVSSGGAGGYEFSLRDSTLTRDASLLLLSRCASCHSAELAPSVSAATLVAAGWVVPGDWQQSLLMGRVDGTQGALMPPGQPLNSAEIQLLRSWIATEFIRVEPAPGASPPAPPGPLPAPTTAAEILQRSCASCHGPSSAGDGGINYITDVARLVSGGWIAPGNPDASVLFREVVGRTMPPAPAAALPSAQVEILRAWIQTGLSAYQVPLAANYRSLSVNVIGPKCVSCHGPTRAESGVRLDTYARVMREVRAGLPNDSDLYRSIQSGDMPPSGSPDVTSAELGFIYDWILSGAANN